MVKSAPSMGAGFPVSERMVLVGAAIPDDMMAAVIRADPNPQIQTHKLSWAIIRGMEDNGAIIDLISTAAISDYPQTRWLLSPCRRWARENGSDNWVVPFINVFGAKHLTRFLACFVFLLRWSLRHRRIRRRVLLYGLISPHLIAARLTRLLLPIEMVVLITDLPGLCSPNESLCRRALRRVDGRLIRWAIRGCERQFVLTRRIAEDFSPTVPALVVEGIVSTEAESLAHASTAGRHANCSRQPPHADFVILYAGQLLRRYGIPMLLEALALLPEPPFRLWLAGYGDLEQDVRAWARQDERLRFLGVVLPADVFRLSQQATVLVNPRPTREPFTLYSFPSKTLEYMATGRPVISTRLPGIPEEYTPYLIWLHDETAEGLATLLRHLLRMPRAELDEFGRRSQRFVLENKTARVQGRRMLDFMRKGDA